MGDGKVISDLELDQIMLQIAERNDREYQEFLKINNLKQNWDTWDKFVEEKWNY